MTDAKRFGEASTPQMSRRGVLSASIAGAVGVAGLSGARALAGPPTLNAQLSGDLTPIHDPVIIREGDTYHVFGSGGWTHRPSVSWRVSKDLVTWKDNGDPFPDVPAWAEAAVPGAKSMWAPDISFVDGQYRMYYAVSTGGSMRSVIGFATTPTLDRSAPRYGWTDHGLVVETFRGGTYNAIDPNFVVDAEGQHWLAFGSYWSGLKLIPLDRETGKPRPGDKRIYSIAYRPAPEGGDNPVEGAFIFQRNGWYYLFASYDYCCKKEMSNYYVAVGRCRKITGPYLGKDGKSMMDGYGAAVIVERPWGATRWRGPGHCGLYRDRDRDLIVYHAYDTQHDSAPTMRLAELSWSADGWPTALT
jgi:arabinan endo-1,5-alpha-L-arabinosidase